MNLRALIRRFVSLAIAAGLAIAPATPLMAAMPSVAAAATMTAAGMDDDAMQMADEMPCCPDQTKAKDCGSCPLVALCTFTISLPAPASNGVLVERYPQRTAFTAIDNLLIDGLAAKPPDHPPRTTV